MMEAPLETPECERAVHVRNKEAYLPAVLLPKDNPTALARRVDYLLERDRFMCPPRGYDVRPLLLTEFDMTLMNGM